VLCVLVSGSPPIFMTHIMLNALLFAQTQAVEAKPTMPQPSYMIVAVALARALPLLVKSRFQMSARPTQLVHAAVANPGQLTCTLHHLPPSTNNHRLPGASG